MTYSPPMWRIRRPPPPLSLFTYMTCVAVVDGQRGTFNNVIGKIGKIKTPGQQKGNTNYGMHI